MNTLIIVGLITYASILRPILEEGQVDTHHMWVWQLFTIAIVVVPSWIPFWSEFALLLCFVIGCIDARVLSDRVRSLVFPTIRQRLLFLRGRVKLAYPSPTEAPLDSATPSPGDSSTVLVESDT
tara:strand:- start:1044 stop:1415 length:372 start_codon:yes stop_codon:yes gene_type:complete